MIPVTYGYARVSKTDDASPEPCWTASPTTSTSWK